MLVVALILFIGFPIATCVGTSSKYSTIVLIGNKPNKSEKKDEE